MIPSDLAPECRDLLADHFDFDAGADLDFQPGFSVDGAITTAVAVDASGGAFAHCRLGTGMEAILYASPDRQGGAVAADLREWLTVLVALPSWFDLLKFSGGGIARRDAARAALPGK